MKFTLSNDHQKDRVMNTLLTGLMIFILLFLGFDLLFRSEQTGLTYTTMYTTLFGDEEAFLDPLPFSSLLEMLHADTFFAMMLLLTLGAVYGRVARSKIARVILINITMLSALLSIITPLLAYYYSPLFIWLWLITLFTWHTGAVAMSLISLWRLHRP